MRALRNVGTLGEVPGYTGEIINTISLGTPHSPEEWTYLDVEYGTARKEEKRKTTEKMGVVKNDMQRASVTERTLGMR